MSGSRTRGDRARRGATSAALLAAGTLLTGTLVAADIANAADDVQYNRDIRRVLSDKCFACHGRDAEQREGDLRLDERQDVLVEAESGELPIVPGDASASEVYRRIVSDDDDARMPPPDESKQLTKEEIDLIRRWIAQGAKYQSHWSFEPISKTRIHRASIEYDKDQCGREASQTPHYDACRQGELGVAGNTLSDASSGRMRPASNWHGARQTATA